MLDALLCRLFGHKIDRRHVWYDDLDFRTNCRRCRQPMLRSMHGWRLFDTDTDSDERRAAHPKDR